MIRIVLVFLIVFLIVRTFIIAGSSSVKESGGGEPASDRKDKKKGVPKEIGEYIDYEEIKKKG
jgi:hypothetical protein